MRVLVVDDNDINRIVICSFLKTMDVRIQEADSGEAALSLCKSVPFDVLLLDIPMPGMDGYQTLEAIRAQSVNGGARQGKAFAVTAHSLPADIEEARTRCFDGHIAKPVSKSDLHEAIFFGRCSARTLERVTLDSLT